MRRKLKRSVAAVATVLVAIVWAFPVYWMINSSFLTPLTISRLDPTFVPFGGTFQNYRAVTTETPFSEALKMSILVVAATLFVCIAFATLAAFAISRFRFKGRRSFVLTVILVQMLPAEAMFIAQFKMIAGMGLLDSLAGVSIIYVAMVVPFTIWMLRGFIASVPAELEEAAMVDGCTRLGAFRRITFPLIAPGLVASGVFAFIQVWNEFALASVLLSDDEVQTLPLWLRDIAQQSNLGAPEWGQIMAGSVLVAVPVMIFFVIVQGRMAQGLVGGAVKG